jgi:hypothetical protein
MKGKLFPSCDAGIDPCPSVEKECGIFATSIRSVQATLIITEIGEAEVGQFGSHHGQAVVGLGRDAGGPNRRRQPSGIHGGVS